MASFDPEETTADPGGLNGDADSLRTMGGMALGRGEDLGDRIMTGAVDFHDEVAGLVEEHGADAGSKAQEVMQSFYYGAGVTSAFGEDVQTYKSLVASLQERWENGLTNIATSLTDEDEIEEAKAQLAKQLNGEADEGYSELQDAAQERAGQLESAPSMEVLRQLNAGGHLGWAGWNLWGSEVGTPPLDDVGDPYPADKLPQDDWSVEQTNEWWESLSAQEKANIVHHYPDVIGGQDGVPTVYRDVANRVNLDREIDALTKQGYEGSLSEDEQAKLVGLHDISDRLDQNQSAGPDRAYLLLIDGSEDGQAAVSVGNPDTASNVFTYVPGTKASVANFDGEMSKVDAMHADADDRANTAGIMWLGYDAPDNFGNAGSPSYAEDASGDLRDFQTGLAHASQTGTNYTLVGHSYGSTVIGHADTSSDDGVHADQMVFLGSPGVGVDHASDLSVGEENVYSSTAANDVIREVPDAGWAHGNSPGNESFGGNVFESPDGEGDGWGERISTHGAYWNDGNPVRDDVADIVVGDGEEIELTDPRPAPPANGGPNGPSGNGPIN